MTRVPFFSLRAPERLLGQILILSPELARQSFSAAARMAALCSGIPMRCARFPAFQVFICIFEECAMFPGKYGPFAQTVAIAGALLALFSLFLLRMVGKVSSWTWLAHDSPSFMVTAGARVVTVALITVSFILIDKSNYGWFAGAAAIFGIAAALLIGRFNRLRLSHICKVPLLDADGSRAKTFLLRRPKFEQLVIGDETDMNAAAAQAYGKLRGVSLCKFMSGYGRNGVNDPKRFGAKQPSRGSAMR
jgi:hypothetical protein